MEQGEEDLHKELKALYSRLGDEIAGLKPRCDACGMCCNFATFDHVLYASSIEVDYLLKNTPVPDFNIKNNVCPYLKYKRCSIRDSRMLACRTFYCRDQFKIATQALHEKYHKLIKELYSKYNKKWKYRPFLSQLLEAKEKRASVVSEIDEKKGSTG